MQRQVTENTGRKELNAYKLGRQICYVLQRGQLGQIHEDLQPSDSVARLEAAYASLHSRP